ncbi:MAG TPA: cytochrome D1 domain-containing protein [Casimicrobiaceae bacterium]|nr:cytochrome D1 domain-containing protein [Casimicrobiaceae bacterium]
MTSRPMAALAAVACALAVPAGAAAPGAAELFATHCAACHGADRLGGIGPALLPENLERLRKPLAAETIAKGRLATQMPAFEPTLAKDEIDALVAFVYTPPPTRPVWGAKEIEATRVVYHAEGTLPAKPQFAADPLNLFVVVESGDHHASILDGDRLERIARFKTRFALHGGPKFTPDGRYVFFASRDGWVTKYDLWNLETVAEVRAGINTRNIAVSSDGKWVVAGNYLPHTVVLLDARDLSLVRLIPAADRAGRSSRVSAVYDAAPRRSFIVALKDVPELWELPYDPKAPPVYEGYVHDYRMGEGLAEKGPFPVRRIALDDVLDDFFFDAPYDHLIGASREAGKGQVVNLNVRRKIATVDLPGLPHLGSGITWEWNGTPVVATTNLKDGVVSVVDMKSWKTVAAIPVNGPGFFLRSHDATPYAWVDAMNSAKKDTLQVIDKRTLAVVRSLTPAPGKTAAHVEFDRYGKYALASVWENDGAIVVYDAATFAEVKRIPASKPVGKYNVWNKITREAGTSH